MRETSSERPTPYLIFCIFMLSLLNMQDGYDILAVSYAAHAISEDWGISRSGLGVIFSAGLFGMMIGAMGLGPLADRIGRKTMCIIGLILSGCGMLVAMQASGLNILVAGRVLTGLGVGGILASVNTLVSEYAGDKYRVAAIAFFQLGFPMGAFLAGFLAAWLLGIGNWRYVFAFGAFTSFAFIPIVLLLPKSTTFLANSQGEEALGEINTIRRRFGQTELTALPGPSVQTKLTVFQSLKSLVQREHRARTLLIWLAFFLLLTTLYFLLSWTPKMLIDMGFTEAEGNRGGRLINLTGMIGIVLLGLLSFRIRPALITSVYLICLCGLMIAFGQIRLELFYVLLMVGAIGVFIHGAMIGLYSTVPSLYPAKLRATGTGWAIGISRFGAVIGPASAGFLFDSGWLPQDIFVLFALPCALAALAAFALWRIERSQNKAVDFI